MIQNFSSDLPLICDSVKIVSAHLIDLIEAVVLTVGSTKPHFRLPRSVNL
jgi:hypothetical protein